MKINEITDMSPGDREKVSQPELQKFIEMIKTNCGDALRSMDRTQKFLHRGVGGNPPEIFVSRSREDRRPVDSDEGLTKIYDNFLKQLGFKSLRSNSIFCSPQYRVAREYGAVFYIFPFDGFNFTWSKNISDNVLTFNQIHYFLDYNLVHSYYEKHVVPYLDMISNYLKEHPSQDGFVFDKSFRIPSSFYGTKTRIDHFQKTIAAMKDKGLPIPDETLKYSDTSNFMTAEAMQKNMQLSNTDFDAALERRNEIMISGKYYGLNARSDFGIDIGRYLGIKTEFVDDFEDQFSDED